MTFEPGEHLSLSRSLCLPQPQLPVFPSSAMDEPIISLTLEGLVSVSSCAADYHQCLHRVFLLLFWFFSHPFFVTGSYSVLQASLEFFT